MTDESTNLVLEHLKRIQSEMVRIRDEQRTMQSSLTAVHQTLAAHSTLLNQLVEDGVTMRARLDRIERRLDLVDAVA